MAPGLVLLCMLPPLKTTVEQTTQVEDSDNEDNHKCMGLCACVCVYVYISFNRKFRKVKK